MKRRIFLLIFTIYSLALNGQQAIVLSKIEEKILNKVQTLKEVRQYEKEILKNGCHVSSMINRIDEKRGKYLVRVGIDTPDRFITRFLFEINGKTLNVIRLN